MSDPECVVEIEGLWTRLANRVIHRDVDLCVRGGEVLSLIGSSGSGKTVFLREVIGLQRPERGSVRVFGQDVHRVGERARNEICRRWGVLFQGGALFSALDVFANVALPLRELRSLGEAAIEDLVMLKLTMVGLAPADATKMPAELSGGMVKRAALARALALDPELLFLDEPTSGLDPVSGEAFQELIKGLRKDLGLTVMMITHDVDTLAALSDRVAVLADERLIATGPLDDVMQADHPFVREYFGRAHRQL